MSALIYRLKNAWAGLGKKPGFVATVVISLGLTLGALLSVITLADLMLLKPLTYPDQERLYQVQHARVDQTGEVSNRFFNYPGMIELYKKQTVFSEAALVYYGEDLMTSHPAQPAMATGYVTPEWFSLLAVPMKLGRGFEQTEALDTFNPVALLSEKIWREEFAADPSIVGKKISFNRVSFQVIGVIDESFVEPEIFDTGLATDVWVPWDYNGSPQFMRNRWTSTNSHQMFIAKLKDGVTASQAQQTLTPMVDSAWQAQVVGQQRFAGKHIEIRLNQLKTVILGDSETTVYLLLAGMIGLLFIASANMTNLFMSRTAEQQRQLAIHAVLGARRSDIFKNLLAESGILMVLAIILALGVCVASFMVLQHYLASQLPRINELNMGAFTLISAVVIGALLALFFAHVSANMINYRILNKIIQTSGKGAGLQVSKGMRHILISSQVCIATVLVFINSSLLQNAVLSIVQPMGFDVDNIVYLKISDAQSQ